MRSRLFVGFVIIGVLLIIGALRVMNDFIERGFVPFSVFLSQVSPGPDEALFFVSPSSDTHNIGDTFQVELRIGASEGVTSIAALLDYDPSLIAVQSMVTSQTAFSTWWEDSFDNIAGRLDFQASAPNPGFSGNNGLIAAITFQAMAEGTAQLTYEASSLALKPDDTNILNIAGSTTGTYTITAPATPPASPPPPPPSSGGGGASGGGGGGGGGGSSSSFGKARGDLNGDGKVNIFDASILISNWGTSAFAYDVNSDGTINIFDASIMITNWTG